MKRRMLALSLLVAAAASVAMAQSAQTDQSPTPPSAPAETKLGGYVVSQSVEFGYRFTDVSSQRLSPGGPTDFSMFNTLVNLHTGPRLLQQTLSLRSPDRSGLLFDSLYVSSFGFGGDPNDLARVDVSKSGWYDFQGLFRRDWNFFNYDLFVNPFNPPTSNPSIPITYSPHQYNSVRRMSDLDLTIKPDSIVSARVGYSRSTDEGPSLTTIPEASESEVIETTLLQRLHTTTDSYRAGIDFRFIPKTTVSYDQFVTHTKYDTAYSDSGFAWVLPNGAPADLGISWNTSAGWPCAAPFSPAPPAADPTCSLYLAYNRSNPFRTTTPTEQLTVRSKLIPRADFTGRASYSATTMSGSFFDFFNGFLADQGIRQFVTFGPMNAKRVNVSVDAGTTIQVTKRLRIVDQFRFYNFRIPSFWNSTLQTWAGASALDTVAPTPDGVDNTLFSRFLGENTESNEIRLAYDFTRRVGATAGYRYQRTTYTHLGELNDLTTGDVETDADVVEVHFHTAIMGLWLRPNDKLRTNFDAELTTADNFLTRISPRRSYLYRARAQYQPIRWMTLAATGNVYDARNGIQEIAYNAHNRNFGFTVTATRSDRLGVELSYNFNDAASNSFICFQDLAATLPAGAGSCVADTKGGAPFELYQTYSSRDHYGSAQISVKPMKRLTTKLGYSVVSANGTATILNLLQPYGSLRSNYHRPVGEVAYDFGHGWTGIARWNYYEYLEKTPYFGPTAPRDFHANLTTVGLRYAF